ncbi:MAG: DUF2180 family protein [Actinophytocola sp.]|uniref:DUF2180 family protein n=1 Tax=Actinophytocola sp. TaxID=1872138 RepID=UPI00132AE173|nr:DUF2180 family protein [Actinophytocola sp.]MPZ86098.1 DUF2180 family protein [Actinophytocola sp.]
MHCYNCADRGDTVPAVAVCASCGAAVCRSCARIGSQTTRHYRLFVGGNLLTETRTIACPPCADALATHHPGRFRFATVVEQPAEQMLETQ